MCPAVEGYSGDSTGRGIREKEETALEQRMRGERGAEEEEEEKARGDEIFACFSRLTETLGKFILRQ